MQMIIFCLFLFWYKIRQWTSFSSPLCFASMLTAQCKQIKVAKKDNIVMHLLRLCSYSYIYSFASFLSAKVDHKLHLHSSPNILNKKWPEKLRRYAPTSVIPVWFQSDPKVIPKTDGESDINCINGLSENLKSSPFFCGFNFFYVETSSGLSRCSSDAFISSDTCGIIIIIYNDCLIILVSSSHHHHHKHHQHHQLYLKMTSCLSNLHGSLASDIHCLQF